MWVPFSVTLKHYPHPYLCECEIDSVSERCDDEPPVETHVFIPIPKLPGTLSYDQLVWFLQPVKSQLRLPLKLIGIHNTETEQEQNAKSLPGVLYMARIVVSCCPIDITIRKY